ATTAFAINQVFLTTTLLYILFPTLMVVLSLLLKPPVNRVVNIVVSLFYIVTIVASCIGETWVYYFLGSAIEIALLAAIIQTAWTWPPAQKAAGTATPG
ncbi:MAG TPA: hypothetical protein VHN99_00090, partial [Deinococcales bacterium]|nr:hypothetical protein [Deinococcales bacterium]